MMDLVPILSTIILVATLATLVLAVIAYFLYKSRERKARAAASMRRDTVVATPMGTADAHMLVAPQYGASPYGAPAAPAYVPTMAALQAAPMMAADTNFDGRMDTLYTPPAAMPAAGMPVAQSFTSRAQYEQPVQPVVPVAPVVPIAQAAPAPPIGSSMFYEYTQGNLVPMAPAAPAGPTMAPLDPYASQQAQIDAARMQAQRAENTAERAQDRLDAQRRRDDGLDWL